MKVPLALRLNGLDYEVEVAPTATLLDVLRYELGQTGTKENCLKGECGVCTVLLNGEPVYSCLVLALMARDCEISTVEGLANGPHLSALQEAFLRHGAVQCGYCTPGMLMSASALLRRQPNPSDRDVRDALAGNLCRCTGYGKIVAAVRDAAAQAAHAPGSAAVVEATE